VAQQQVAQQQVAQQQVAQQQVAQQVVVELQRGMKSLIGKKSTCSSGRCALAAARLASSESALRREVG